MIRLHTGSYFLTIGDGKYLIKLEIFSIAILDPLAGFPFAGVSDIVDETGCDGVITLITV